MPALVAVMFSVRSESVLVWCLWAAYRRLAAACHECGRVVRDVVSVVRSNSKCVTPVRSRDPARCSSLSAVVSSHTVGAVAGQHTNCLWKPRAEQ